MSRAGITCGLFWCALIGSLSADDVDPKLAKLLNDWNSAKKKIDTAFIRAFDQEMAAIKKDRSVAAEVRNTRIELIKEQKGAFLEDGELPNYDNMLGASFIYLDSLQKAGEPLRKYFEVALEKAIGTGAKFDAISAAKETWQSKFPGRGELCAGTEFHGTRTFSDGRAVDFHLHVWTFEDNIFVGEIWQEVQSIPAKSGWQYEAKLEGNQFVLSTRKMVHGAPRQLVFRGYIVGRRVLMTLTQKDGIPLTGDLVSAWKK